MWSSYDHTTVKAPHPIRTAKLSTVGPDQYYGRGLRGNLRCCMAFFYFLSICPTAQAGPRHDSLVGLVGLVGQAAPMPDSLVGQAAGCFCFFSQVGNMNGPGHQGPARVVRVRTRAASVASFGYIHEAEERSK